MRVWLAARYVCSPPVFVRPESGGRQPRIHHDLDDPLLLDPQTRWIVGELLKHTAVASTSDLTQVPLTMGAECNRSRQSRRTGAATTGRRGAATPGSVDNAAALLREKGVDIADASLRAQRVERGPEVRGEDREILLDAATHGVTGTYDRAAQSTTEYGTLGVSGGRGEKRVADEESTRARLQYLSAPESGGRQPRILSRRQRPSAS